METKIDYKKYILGTTIDKYCSKYINKTENASVIYDKNLQSINDKLNILISTLSNITTSQNYSQNASTVTLLSKGDEETMPSITLRADGRYMIRKYHNGIRKTIYAKTLTAAKEIYKKFKKNKIEINKSENHKIYTLESWLNEWSETYKKNFVSKSSYDDIVRIIKNISAKFKKTYLKDLTTKQIQCFLNTMKKSRKKEKIITYFNASLEKATNLNIIIKNPFKAVERETKIKNKRNAFTFDEQKKIMNGLENSNIKIEILIYLLTGCRPAELPKEDNFDFKNNLVKIIGTKTEKSKLRFVELSKEFSNKLQIYLKTNKLKSRIYVREKFKELCLKQNINDGIIYKLRHTFASNNFILGTQAKQVQEWLGHSNISMTLDIYTDIDKTCSKEKIHMLYNNLYYEN